MQKIIAKNKFAKSDYEILDKYVAGIELQGWEVKSIRANNVNLKNSFCSFKKHELFVSNMHVSPWMLEKNDEFRARKLLLHKNELLRILTKTEKFKCTIIPLSIFWLNGKIKLEISIAKKRSKFDKRQIIKENDDKRIIKNIF
ncbi:MAG: SsrA-binding protein SmpB [Mycoplasmataceae bacterium]|nr:SsrA-binding protein SmpB [Mycoplasmataceae bacterium]MBR3571411.1 SsrA-binding protein SmpB [Mycoplasmataceae bacterium]